MALNAISHSSGSGVFPALVFVQGSEQKNIVLNRTPFTVGRKVDKDLVIADPRVSRDHAQIMQEGQDFFLVDLGSKHGTLRKRGAHPAPEAGARRPSGIWRARFRLYPVQSRPRHFQHRARISEPDFRHSDQAGSDGPPTWRNSRCFWKLRASSIPPACSTRS